MSKWQKIDPAEIKVGDRVRAVGHGLVVKGEADDDATNVIILSDLELGVNAFTWYIRKKPELSPTEKAQFTLTMPKPDSDLADGHTAHYWRNKYNKQLDHSKQLEASNAGRRVKMQGLEKEAEDARHSEIKWASRYAVLAASINEVPDEPTPPTRPDEPPVGSFFRVDRTGGKFLSIEPNGDYRYLVLDHATDDWPSDTRPWETITEPGDTWTLLELREVEK